MKELSLNILDIAENSVKAEATLTEITIEESDTTELESAVSYYEKLKATLPETIQLGLLHGKMKNEEKNRIFEVSFDYGLFDFNSSFFMRNFRSGNGLCDDHHCMDRASGRFKRGILLEGKNREPKQDSVQSY